MTRFFKTFALTGLALAALSPAAATASESTLLSTHGAWSVYSFTENGNKVCYMAATPTKAEGNYSARGKIYALITHRPAEGTKNVFSYITGYSYKDGSEVNLTVGSEKFNLFTQDETAWAADADADIRLTEAIRKGSTMVVKGVSKKGTETTDTYSLSGSGEAYSAISKECGL
jgi:invasion protein IalB